MEYVKVPSYCFVDVDSSETALVAQDFGKPGTFVAVLGCDRDCGLLLTLECLSDWLEDIHDRDPDDVLDDYSEIVFDAVVDYSSRGKWEDIDAASKVKVKFTFHGPFTIMVRYDDQAVSVTPVQTADLVRELDSLRILMEKEA